MVSIEEKLSSSPRENASSATVQNQGGKKDKNMIFDDLESPKLHFNDDQNEVI